MKLKVMKSEETELGKREAEMKMALEAKREDLKAEWERLRKRSERIKRVVREEARSESKRKPDDDAGDGHGKVKRENVEESYVDEEPMMDARKAET